ncbi:hypothetical protein ACA910_014940 [Epithemia clementina (nom. ined.)]
MQKITGNSRSAKVSFFDNAIGSETNHLLDVIDKTLTGRRVGKQNSKNEPPTHVDWYLVKSTKTEFTLPTVFGATKCMRRLSPAERALCCNIPATISKAWNLDMLHAIVCAITSPVKIADALGQLVQRYLHTIARQSDPNPLKQENASASDVVIQRR